MIDQPGGGLVPKWLLMLRAYIDESGHESKGWMSLAGFLGREEQWRDFVPKWKSALGPQRKFLHMRRLRWKKDSTKQLLARLGPIPEKCGLEAVMAGVRFQDYEDLVSGTPDEKLLKGYIACLIPMVIQILRGIPDDERIELVFEEQREYAPFVDMALPFAAMPEPWKLTKDGRPKLAKWSFVPKGSTVMTDPADYLAFALREVWTDRKSKKAEWCKPILASGSGEGYGLIMQRDRIRRMVTNAQMLFIFQDIHKMIAALSGSG